jgi:hypothetical protein
MKVQTESNRISRSIGVADCRTHFTQFAGVTNNLLRRDDTTSGAPGQRSLGFAMPPRIQHQDGTNVVLISSPLEQIVHVDGP